MRNQCGWEARHRDAAEKVIANDSKNGVKRSSFEGIGLCHAGITPAISRRSRAASGCGRWRRAICGQDRWSSRAPPERVTPEAASERLLVWIGPLSSTRLRSKETVELLQMCDEIAAALGRAGMDDELARDVIERPQHRDLLGLPRRRHPQVRPRLRPGAGEIGMRQRLALIAVEKNKSPASACCLRSCRRRPTRSTSLSV